MRPNDLRLETGTAQTSVVRISLLERHQTTKKLVFRTIFTMKGFNGSAASIFIWGSNTTYTTLLWEYSSSFESDVFAKRALNSIELLGQIDCRHWKTERIQNWDIWSTSARRPSDGDSFSHWNSSQSLKDDVYNGMFIPKGHALLQCIRNSRDEMCTRTPKLQPRSLPAEIGRRWWWALLEGPFDSDVDLRWKIPSSSVGLDRLSQLWFLRRTLASRLARWETVEPVVKFTTGLSSPSCSLWLRIQT